MADTLVQYLMDSSQVLYFLYVPVKYLCWICIPYIIRYQQTLRPEEGKHIFFIFHITYATELLETNE